MTVKHTPGQWKVFAPTSRSSNDMAYGIDSDMGIESTSVVLFYGGILKKEDAMLIAAAPDLLDALIKYMNAIDMFDLASKDGINYHGAIGNRLAAEEIAREAIAKATGKYA